MDACFHFGWLAAWQLSNCVPGSAKRVSMKFDVNKYAWLQSSQLTVTQIIQLHAGHTLIRATGENSAPCQHGDIQFFLLAPQQFLLQLKSDHFVSGMNGKERRAAGSTHGPIIQKADWKGVGWRWRPMMEISLEISFGGFEFKWRQLPCEPFSPTVWWQNNGMFFNYALSPLSQRRQRSRPMKSSPWLVCERERKRAAVSCGWVGCTFGWAGGSRRIKTDDRQTHGFKQQNPISLGYTIPRTLSRKSAHQYFLAKFKLQIFYYYNVIVLKI